MASLLVTALLTLSGCGLFAAADENSGPLAIRTPQPTFTPTVAATIAPPATTTSAAAPAASGLAAAQAERPKAVINTPLLNARSGPNTDSEIIATIERGAEYDIVGISPDGDWWQICCVDGVEAWITSEFVDTLGLVDSVPVIGGGSSAQATTQNAAPVASNTTAPPAAASPATATPAPAPAASFILETQEQFPETGVVRVFLYVYSGNSALEGYSLRVSKDGTALPVEGTSFGGQPAFTWPFQDPRQRFQNFKVEYPETPPQGTWQVQLIDNTGATVGPPATFTLSSNDPQQELYVRYAQQ